MLIHLLYVTFLLSFTFVYTPVLGPTLPKANSSKIFYTRAYLKNKPRGPFPLWEAEETTVLSVHLPVIPVNVPHHTTSYTNWQPEPPPWRPASIATTVALVTCSLATAIALSNRQVTWAGHTLTALTLPHPHLLLLLLPLQTGLRSLEERIPHLGERFWVKHSHVPTTHSLPLHTHISTNVITSPFWYDSANPNLLLSACALAWLHIQAK